MKLLQKTALYLLLVASAIALAGVFLLNRYIHREVVHEIDELLLSDLRQIEYRIRQQPPALTRLPNWDPNVTIIQTTEPGQPGLQYKDSLFVDPRENEPVQIRMLQASYTLGSQQYAITLRQSYLEFNEIARLLSTGVVGCFLIVITLLVGADVLIARRIWQPFYAIIHQLQQYRIDTPEDIQFSTSDVEEFNLLSHSLGEMSRRSRQLYIQQKQFTDNASHEMQTPLSILSFELDQLQQSERLDETELDRIQRSQQVVKRLSSLNRSLLLLAKIDNHQFAHLESVAIGELVDQLLDHFVDYLTHRGMSITRLISAGSIRSLNRQLAEILFSNLINNAVRHGYPDRSILVQVSADTFIITNEGDPLPFPEDQLFQRFVRNQALPQSTGLGLALVKEIADQYQMKVQYVYISNLRRHMFEVTF